MELRSDIVVAGGGIAGVMAAVAAAREGANVALVERYAALGGMATLGLVQPITTWGIAGNYVVGGTGRRILEQLAEKHPHAATGMNLYGPCCDSEYLKFHLETLALEHNVNLLYHTWISGVTMHEGRIEALDGVSKGGKVTIRADVVIDATGDADVAAASGVPFDTGGQGISLMVLAAGIDRKACPDGKTIRDTYARHKVGYRQLALFWHPRPDAAYLNVTEVEGRNALDPRDLTAVTIECRRQAWQVLDILRDHVPGFENAYIAQTAPALGVRESRRIRGNHILTVEEAFEDVPFEDTIARASCPIDIHGSTHDGRGDYAALTHSYGIPFRSLVSDTVRNLIVTGRPISADHATHSSLRRMGPGFAIGEAAGIAAALAASAHRDTPAVPPALLRASLRRYGAILDPEGRTDAS